MLNRWWDKYRLRNFLTSIFFLVSFISYAQVDSLVKSNVIDNSTDGFPTSIYIPSPPIGRIPYPQLDKRKLNYLIIGESAFYLSGMTGAYFLWYKNSLGGGFHTFNDSKEWRLMDKVGHFSSAYVWADFSSKAYYWTNMPKDKADKIAALQSLFLMSSLEVFDGFSSGYGFSWADFGFNVAGAGTFYLSKRFQHVISIVPKFSFGQSKFAQYRPDVLGNNFVQQVFKDYNGQTYWLSFKFNRYLKSSKTYNKYLDCVAFSFGYGANGMTGGHENPLVNEQGMAIPEFQRYSQYYISLDFDFSKLYVRNKFLKGVLTVLNIFKFPFPAVELSRGKVFMNWTSYGI